MPKSSIEKVIENEQEWRRHIFNKLEKIDERMTAQESAHGKTKMTLGYVVAGISLAGSMIMTIILKKFGIT